jgi:dihydrofolate reductase
VPQVKLIAAIDDRRGIAKKVPGTPGKIPWFLPSDRKYFQDKLKQGPVVSGWNTFAANGYKPYGDGTNYVITREKIEAAPGVWIVHDAQEFFEKNKEDIWVAGGGQIFEVALSYATHLYLTRVEGDFDCDIFFPAFEDKFQLTHSEPTQVENGIAFQYQIWQPKT